MRENQQKNGGTRRNLPLFGNLRVLCLAAMLAAMGVVLGYLAKLIFGEGMIRITFENLPIVFGGIVFGPFVGAGIAVVADLASCLLAGQAPVPLITVGSLSIGFLSGVLGRYVLRSRRYGSLLVIELAVHAVGSFFLKSLALHLYFGFAWQLLLLRIPTYLLIAVFEAFFLCVLLRNPHLNSLLKRMMRS